MRSQQRKPVLSFCIGHFLQSPYCPDGVCTGKQQGEQGVRGPTADARTPCLGPTLTPGAPGRPLSIELAQRTAVASLHTIAARPLPRASSSHPAHSAILHPASFCACLALAWLTQNIDRNPSFPRFSANPLCLQPSHPVHPTHTSGRHEPADLAAIDQILSTHSPLLSHQPSAPTHNAQPTTDSCLPPRRP